jgi:hypothetical protein
LTSATGGKEINKRWSQVEDLKKAYQESRGFEIELDMIQAAKKSFIEKGFNYNRGISNFSKLEDCLFQWIDKQKKGFNTDIKKYDDTNDDGTPAYMMGLTR